MCDRSSQDELTIILIVNVHDQPRNLNSFKQHFNIFDIILYRITLLYRIMYARFI